MNHAVGFVVVEHRCGADVTAVNLREGAEPSAVQRWQHDLLTVCLDADGSLAQHSRRGSAETPALSSSAAQVATDGTERLADALVDCRVRDGAANIGAAERTVAGELLLDRVTGRSSHA